MLFFDKPKKSLGQNFLKDPNIIKKIINIGDIKVLQTVLIKIKDYLPVDDILKGEIGTIKIKI